MPVNLVENTYEFSVWYKCIGQPSEHHAIGFDVQLYDSNHSCLNTWIRNFDFSTVWVKSGMFSTNFFPEEKNNTQYVKLYFWSGYHSNISTNYDVEVRFDDAFIGIGENNPPAKPTIVGKINGTVNIAYDYHIQTTDPDQHCIKYFINWGDGTQTETGLHESGEEIVVSHLWNAEGIYTISVVAADAFYGFSDSTTVTVTMPYSYHKPMLQFMEWLFERFSPAFPILRQLVGY